VSNPPRGARRPTLATLAADLGISRATVSNAYNRPDQLSEELRARVLGRALELGYPGPNPAGRRLNDHSLSTIGVMFSETISYPFSDPAAREFMSGLGAEAQQHQLGILLVPAPVRGPTARQALDNVVLDAIVVYSMPDEDAVLRAAIARRVPLVIVDQPELPDVSYVGFENRLGAAAAMDHVLDLGHLEIAVVTFRLGREGRSGTADLERQTSAIYQNARERLSGYRDAVEAREGSWAGVTVWEQPEHTLDDGYAAGLTLLRDRERPTAIVAFTDVLALGVMRAAAELGLRVPEDLTVVGYDDIPEADSAGLTTVHHPLSQKGSVVGKRLRSLWEPDSTQQSMRFPASLVIRTSSSRPPTR
jgi:DNA-binding LacI/PurR family transcriptional regulator